VYNFYRIGGGRNLFFQRRKGRRDEFPRAVLEKSSASILQRRSIVDAVSVNVGLGSFAGSQYNNHVALHELRLVSHHIGHASFHMVKMVAVVNGQEQVVL